MMGKPKALAQLASNVQEEIDATGLGQPRIAMMPGPLPTAFASLYDVLVTSGSIRESSRQLYVDGHYARAVEEACKCLNNTVKDKSHQSLDGMNLMTRVFSEKNPMLRVNALQTDSQRDEQAGYMFILAGVMRGIRNPRAHEHLLRDEAGPALEMLVLANHLMRVIGGSRRVRNRKTRRLQADPDQ